MSNRRWHGTHRHESGSNALDTRCRASNVAPTFGRRLDGLTRACDARGPRVEEASMRLRLVGLLDPRLLFQPRHPDLRAGEHGRASRARRGHPGGGHPWRHHTHHQSGDWRLSSERQQCRRVVLHHGRLSGHLHTRSGAVGIREIQPAGHPPRSGPDDDSRGGASAGRGH